MTQVDSSSASSATGSSTVISRLHSGVRRYSVAWFLSFLTLLFVVTPLVERVRFGDVVEAVLLSLVLLSAVLAVGGRRSTMVWAIALVLPAVVGKWINHVNPNLMPAEIFVSFTMIFMAFIVFELTKYIIRARRVDSEVLCAGVATYLMIGLCWSMAYILAARLDPDAFVFSAGVGPGRVMKGFTAAYFSFITLTTCGYGDIIPASSIARMLALVEAVVGVLYMAVLISRLVSMYSTKHSADSPEDS